MLVVSNGVRHVAEGAAYDGVSLGLHQETHFGQLHERNPRQTERARRVGCARWVDSRPLTRHIMAQSRSFLSTDFIGCVSSKWLENERSGRDS